jgi:uncharacterized protein YqiB (DUF1249 family)
MAEVETYEAVEFKVVAKIKYTNKNHRRSLLKNIREFLSDWAAFCAYRGCGLNAKLISLKATLKK